MPNEKAALNSSIEERLLALRNEAYREFTARLIPTLDKKVIIGIRTPHLRALARVLSEEEKAAFISELPHRYYEENNLHAFILEGIRDFGALRRELLRFLPYVDNLATCDSMSPVIFRRRPEGLFDFAVSLLEAKDTYSVRFGISILMKHFTDSELAENAIGRVAKIKSDEYYIRMMQAWFFQVALAKLYNAAIPYLTERRLAPWVHNKTIQKCRESRLFTNEEKDFLKSLKY